MSKEASRLARRKRAKTRLADLQRHEENSFIVHYSCESFYERPDGSSPRITSLAVRNLGTEQTRSFSIHQVAERNGIPLSHITSHYDKLEKQMLDEFFEFVRQHQSDRWAHWNMRDAKFGFPAIEHRHQVLGGIPFQLDDTRKYNLASILIDLYGVGYVKNPRLPNLMKLNKVSERDFLDGGDEAKAFVDGEFVKLHQSTLRKVDNIANLYERTVNGTLKTNATFRQTYGGLLPWLGGQLQEHWLFALLALVGSIASIVGLAMTL
jgi:hypothetical protein